MFVVGVSNGVPVGVLGGQCVAVPVVRVGDLRAHTIGGVVHADQVTSDRVIHELGVHGVPDRGLGAVSTRARVTGW